MITCEMFVVSCGIHMITCEMFVVTCGIHMITCEIYDHNYVILKHIMYNFYITVPGFIRERLHSVFSQ